MHHLCAIGKGEGIRAGKERKKRRQLSFDIRGGEIMTVLEIPS